MGKSIIYSNEDFDINTEVEIKIENQGVFLTTKWKSDECFHVFSDHNELDDFITELIKLKNQLKDAKNII